VDEGFARAREYARKAIALDDGLAEAHASLAWVLFIYDWDFAGARAEFLRAIELQPKYATAHQWYAFLLAARGDVDEGLVEAHTATELDPASVSVRRSLAWLYMYARRHDRARDQIQRAIEMNPTADENYRILALTLALMGDVAEAERVCREALTLPGAGTYTTATLGYILGRAGREDEAREILAGLAARARVGYVSPVAFATVLLGLGDTRGALDWAERAVAERRGWPLYFRVNPVVDPLRGDPRFQDLLRRIGI
jgi:serine/threonine-protein kinase